MTTKEKANCDQCGSSFQPKRTNKTGPSFCGATCRQRAHRRNGQQRHGPSSQRPMTKDIPRIASDDPDVWNRLTVQLGMRQQAAKAKRPGIRLQFVEAYLDSVLGDRQRLGEEVQRLEERLRREEERRRRESERYAEFVDDYDEMIRKYDSMFDAYQTELKSLRVRARAGGGGLTEAEWNQLKQFNDQQLRQWVKAGRVMERKGHDSPMRNASKWVEGNSLELSGSVAAQGDEDAEFSLGQTYK